MRKSQIPKAGYGLFAVRAFPRHALLGNYTGKPYTLAEIERKPIAQRRYVLCDSRKHCVDAAEPTSTPFRYMNDPRGSKFKANVIFTNGRNFPVRTTRAIKPGEELFVEYGDSYWQE